MPTYVGTFIIAFVTLALEITLTRLLSVISWYHLAFLAISTAMLGMTAGAVAVFLRPQAFTPDRLSASLVKASLAFAISAPMALVVLCLDSMSVNSSTVMGVLGMVVATVACAAPFYFSGICVSAVLTKSALPIGKLYAADLLGASLGCLFVLLGLDHLDAPSLVLLCSAIAVLAAQSYGWGDTSFLRRWFGPALFLGLIACVQLNSRSSLALRPVVVKGGVEEPATFLLEKWNSFSRIVVYKGEVATPQCWGPSPLMPQPPLLQYEMNIDGLAGTTVRQFHSNDDLEHLRFDVTNLGHFLRPTGDAMVIGAGGGRDVQSAVLFGHKSVTGVDVNPIFIHLLQNEFRDFAGLAARDDVSLIVDEARSYLSRTPRKFTTIQMSLIDTWAATGAGAFSLSENGLYTVEAWQLFLNRLDDDGLFTVSRWFDPSNPGETGRMLSLAVEALLKTGVTDPSEHIAMASSGSVCTLLLTRQPFRKEDVALLNQVIEEKQYVPVVIPGELSDYPVLNGIAHAKNDEELRASVADEQLNLAPPTDENPYFFNILRLSQVPKYLFNPDSLSVAGVLHGNLTATLTLSLLLIILIVLTLVTVVAPLLIKAHLRDPSEGPRPKVHWAGAAYFILIGAGFMFVEIALIQRLSVFLGHPVYALGVLLFTMIASTGIGSFASDNVPLTKTKILFAYPLAAAGAILAVHFALAWLLPAMLASGMLLKILASVATIFPVGLLLGCFFPTGMRLLRSIAAAETPWYWALNGVFGVLCSAVAVFVSINVGISVNFYIAAACYLLMLPALQRICAQQESPTAPAVAHAGGRRAIVFVVAALVGLFAAVSWARGVGGTDLARDAHWRASSVNYDWPPTDAFFVHTKPEDSPWVEFDLGKPTTISRVVVKNRLDCCTERASPLVIELSDDAKTWKEVGRRTDEFSFWYANIPRQSTQYVRLRVDRPSILHLAHVGIYY